MKDLRSYLNFSDTKLDKVFCCVNTICILHYCHFYKISVFKCSSHLNAQEVCISYNFYIQILFSTGIPAILDQMLWRWKWVVAIFLQMLEPSFLLMNTKLYSLQPRTDSGSSNMYLPPTVTPCFNYLSCNSQTIVLKNYIKNTKHYRNTRY